ncbi:acyl-CoA carboxylase subunit epsilon [Streptomyces sp. NPDC003691]
MTEPAAGTPDPSLLRVERGRCEPEELAAVTALLMARAAAAPPPGTGGRRCSSAPWHRLEPTSGFRPPHSWRHR